MVSPGGGATHSDAVGPFNIIADLIDERRQIWAANDLKVKRNKWSDDDDDDYNIDSYGLKQWYERWTITKIYRFYQTDSTW